MRLFFFPSLTSRKKINTDRQRNKSFLFFHTKTISLIFPYKFLNIFRGSPRYAFARRTFLKEKYIFVVVCISCLKKVLHLSNIFLKKNKKHDVSSFQQQKQRKQREVSKQTTTFLQSTFTNITTSKPNERSCRFFGIFWSVSPPPLVTGLSLKFHNFFSI